MPTPEWWFLSAPRRGRGGAVPPPLPGRGAQAPRGAPVTRGALPVPPVARGVPTPRARGAPSVPGYRPPPPPAHEPYEDYVSTRLYSHRASQALWWAPSPSEMEQCRPKAPLSLTLFPCRWTRVWVRECVCRPVLGGVGLWICSQLGFGYERSCWIVLGVSQKSYTDILKFVLYTQSQFLP